MKPTDLPLLWELSRPRLSPDGRRVAVAVRRADLESNTYRGEVWVMALDGSSRPERFTHGRLDSDPAWSPDGRWLSFLRANPGADGPAGKPQLHVMAVGGGEPVALTSNHLGVNGAVWSPDSRAVAYLARVPEPGRYGTDPRVGPKEEPPRHIRQLSYKRDLVGYKADQRRHVFLVDVPSTLATWSPCPPLQLTEGDYDHTSLCWSPSGVELAVVSARHEDRDVRLVQDAFLLSVPDGKLCQVTDTSLVVARPTFSSDGQELYFLGYRPEKGGRDVFGFHSALWVVPTHGPSAPERLTPPGVALPSDRSPDLPTSAVLLVEPAGVLVERQHRGAVQLVRVARDGEVRELVSGPREVLGFDAVGEARVVTVATDANCGEVVALEPNGERVLSDFGRPAREGSRQFPCEEIDGVAPDGYPVHGFLVRPDGEGPYPLIVFINGGPFVMAGWKIFDEAQVYAGAGYAVLMSNERGRAGYGEEHGRAVMGQMARMGASDILSLLDATLAQPGFDPGRVAVMGGSYGGFMTSWLVTQTDRFAAAISERALNDWDRSGDIGYYYPDYYVGETPEAMRASSPIAHVDAITTPMLLVHSEDDIDVPLSQAERLFFYLKLRGCEVEMLIFPGEGHDLTRSGLPRHRVQRFDAILEWLRRFLQPA